MLDQSVHYQPPGAQTAEKRYRDSLEAMKANRTEKTKSNFLQGLRQRFSKQNFEADQDTGGATQIQIIEQARGFFSENGKWILLGLAILAGAAILYFKAPTFGPITGIRFSGPALASFVIRFSELALVTTGILSLVEAGDRNDPLLLDWWLALVEWAILIWVGITGLTFSSGIFAGIGLGGLIAGTFWNRGEETEMNLWNRWDTSGLFTLSFVLILTHLANWQSIPYPAFIPLPVIYLVAAFSLFKELARSVKELVFGLAVLLFGAIAGFYMTWTVIAITAAVTVMCIYAAAWQEWIPTNNSRRSSTIQNIGPMSLKVIKAWDIAFAWWAAFVLTGLQFHQNFPLIILGK